MNGITMRRVLANRRSHRDNHVMVQPTEMNGDPQQESFTSVMKKPFRCFAGRHDPYESMHVMAPSEQYIPPGGSEFDYGFEATLQEKKKKTRSRSLSRPRSLRNKKEKLKEESASNSDTMTREVVPPDNSGLELRRNRSLEKSPPSMAPYPFSSSGGSYDLNSFGSRRSFADAIPPGKKNDPLDHESIRDVSKALKEMERKLEAAGTEGKKVSRTKVMKALLTVVDQLDDQYDFSNDLPPASNNASFGGSTSADLYRTWTGGDASSSEDAIARDRHRRNLEQMRELTITPQKDYSGRPDSRGTPTSSKPFVASDSPWKGDKPSFSKLNEEVKAVSTATTEAEAEYISSSSDDEDEETVFTDEQSTKADNSTFYSEDAPGFKDMSQRGKSKKGSFAHAVSPSAARSASPPSKRSASPSTSIFNLDMKDPAVQDALSDLLWIQSPTKSIEAQSKLAVVSPETSSNDHHDEVLDKLRTQSQSMLSYHQSEQEYYDDEKIEEQESATSTTQSSSAASSYQAAASKPKRRENSWWQRRNRAALKPPSKDTPIVQEQHHSRHQQQQGHYETRVTVTHQYSNDDSDPWKPSRADYRWEEH